jgi:hypothetical protein
MFSKRFEDLADRLSGKVVPPEWMVDTVIAADEMDTALQAVRREHPLRHCDFAKIGHDGTCVAVCHHVRLKSPGVMVDCTGRKSMSQTAVREFDSTRKLRSAKCQIQ